jgi:NRPS condensation-like uncharacterized protein
MTNHSVNHRRQRFPMTIAEEMFFIFDPPSAPATVQFEFRVSGAIIETRLRDALASAIATHPLARARIVAPRFLLRPPLWEVGDAGETDVLHSMDCSTDREVDSIRDDFYSQPIDLRRSPLLRGLLVHRPGGDSLMLSVHHAMTDGIGALRLVNSVARFYAGQPDPSPAIDALAVRDVRAHFGATGQHQRSPISVRGRVAGLARNTTTPASGYGVCHGLLTADQCRQLDPTRYGESVTLNDLLLAALHLSVAEWNTSRGRPSECIALLAPVNLRPAEWYNEVVANLTFIDRNMTSPDHRSTPDTAVAAVSRQTERLRGGRGFSRLMTRPIWAYRLITGVLLPMALYGARSLRRDDRGPVNTMIASNLGRIERKVADLGGEAGELTEFWFSTPAGMPMGVAMATVILRGRLHISLRYHRRLLDAEAARAFVLLYSDTIMKVGCGES